MAKQSPIAALHEARGVRWVEDGGWLLPLRFGDPLAEYRAVRTNLGFLDLCHRGAFKLTGPDRLSYFQGMVSNDLRNLIPGQGVYAAILNLQGKVIADVRVLCAEESFLVDLWEPLKDNAIAHLNRYLVADEVEIVDLTADYGMISVQGPRALSFLQESVEESAVPQVTLDHVVAHMRGIEVTVVRHSHTGEEGYDFLVPRNHLESFARHSQEIGESLSATWAGQQAWEMLRIESGIPRYGVDFDENHLVLEAGLEQAVNFHKGCYLGQEVVERIRSRGHVNKKLVGLLLEGEMKAEAGAALFADDKRIGTITSSVYSPALRRAVALGYVQRDFWNPDTALSFQQNGARVRAVVTTLPFVRPSHSSGKNTP